MHDGTACRLWVPYCVKCVRLLLLVLKGFQWTITELVVHGLEGGMCLKRNKSEGGEKGFNGCGDCITGFYVF